jgi:hypothetical protein
MLNNINVINQQLKSIKSKCQINHISKHNLEVITSLQTTIQSKEEYIFLSNFVTVY